MASLVCVGRIHSLSLFSEKSQIILSALSATAGSALFWLAITLTLGRFYCSTVCPLGTISDLAMRIAGIFPSRRIPFRYRHPAKFSIHILWIYILATIIGIMIVPYLISPWNIMRDWAAAFNLSAISTTWLNLGISALIPIVWGWSVMAFIIVLGALKGRRYCTDFCPLGIALGYLSNYSLSHIEIDHDKCSACGKCEDICRSQCIKVVSRYVDNARCVRCLDCIDKCPDNAIHLQINRNRPATPLMSRVKKADKQ